MGRHLRLIPSIRSVGLVLAFVTLLMNFSIYFKHDLSPIHFFSNCHRSDFSILLIIITQKRKSSFLRLWASIEDSLPISRSVNLRIIWDSYPNMSQKQRAHYDFVVHNLTSLHGPVRVDVHTTQFGLKKTILTAWNATDANEFAILLEDDIEVSPYFLVFAENALITYRRDIVNSRFMGVSLFHELFNEVIQFPTSVESNGNPFFYQMPTSWGGIYFPASWRRFLDYVADLPPNRDPQVPGSLTNIWRHQYSWKKYLISFMYQYENYMLYTNFPNNMSLTTNHAEPGTNFIHKLSAEHMKRTYMPSLVPLSQHVPEFLFNFPPVNELQAYDMFLRRVPSHSFSLV